MKASIIGFLIAVSAYTVLSKPTFTVIDKTAEDTGTLNFETIFNVLTCAFSGIDIASDDTADDASSDATTADDSSDDTTDDVSSDDTTDDTSSGDTTDDVMSDDTTSDYTTSEDTASDDYETAE